jgi:hypothetical protein
MALRTLRGRCVALLGLQHQIRHALEGRPQGVPRLREEFGRFNPLLFGQCLVIAHQPARQLRRRYRGAQCRAIDFGVSQRMAAAQVEQALVVKAGARLRALQLQPVGGNRIRRRAAAAGVDLAHDAVHPGSGLTPLLGRRRHRGSRFQSDCTIDFAGELAHLWVVFDRAQIRLHAGRHRGRSRCVQRIGLGLQATQAVVVELDQQATVHAACVDVRQRIGQRHRRRGHRCIQTQPALGFGACHDQACTGQREAQHSPTPTHPASLQHVW